MKMKKIIVAAMAIGCCLTNAFGDEYTAEANGKTWLFEASGSSATLVHATDSTFSSDGYIDWYLGLSGNVVIPARLVCKEGAFTVTAIAPNTLRGDLALTSLRIPATVTSIGDGAFYGCPNLEKVKFDGNACDTMGEDAFADTPYYEMQENTWQRRNRNSTIANACTIEFFKDGARGVVNDSNIYLPGDASDLYYTVVPRWYKVKAQKSGYMTLNTWATGEGYDDCDLEIDVTQGYDLSAEDAPTEPPTRWTATGDYPDGFVHAEVEAGKTYFIKVTGHKNKGRRARGCYALNLHFGQNRALVTLRPNGGKVPFDLLSFYAPTGSSIGQLPTPTREGYSFTGWYWDANCKKKYDLNTMLGLNETMRTLYAGWKAVTYSIAAVNDTSRGAKVAVKVPNSSNKTVTYQDASCVYGKFAPFNSSVTLVATPMDGYIFDRWQFSADDGLTSSGFLDDAAGAALIYKFVASLRNPTLTFNMPARNLIAAAQYIPSWKDYARPVLGQPTEWYLEDGVRECTFKFACGTYPKVSYSATKGLIGDMAFSWNYDGTNVTCMLIANDRAMKKPGIWTLSVTVNGQSGAKAGHVLKIIGANDKTATTASQSGPARLMGLNTDCRHTPYTNLVVGVKCNAEDWAQYGIHADTANGWNIVEVSGVPGVSFNPKLNNGYGGLTGVPKKAGTFVATVTVEKVTKKKSGKKIKVTTESKDATCLVVVQPLPEWLVGSFGGWTTELLPGYLDEKGESAYYGFIGSSRIVKATIGSTGKFSADVGGVKFAANYLTQDVFWSSSSSPDEPKHRVVYAYSADIVNQSKDTAGKNKGKVTTKDELHVDFGCSWTNFYDPAANGRCTRWRRYNNSTQAANVWLFRNEFGKSLTAMDPVVYDMLVQIYYDGNGDVRVTDLTDERFEEDDFYAACVEDVPYYTASTGSLDGRKRLYNALWTDGAGTAYFSGYARWPGKQIDMSGSALMCIERIDESKVGDPHLDWVRTPAEWREAPGYVVFAKFKKDGYALEVAWHFSGLDHPVLDGIRGALLP